MKCCICKQEIQPRVDENGKVFWKGGNNAEPLVMRSDTEHARCCDVCDCLLVIPYRMGFIDKVAYDLGKQLLEMRMNPPSLNRLLKEDLE